jgi:RES domain-containing protein
LTTVWRILRRAYAASAFDGEGAYRYGGRWSSSGTRVVYTSEHLSLAMLEYFVHIDRAHPPRDLVVVRAAIPDSVSRRVVSLPELPANWRTTPAPAELALLGDQFVAEQEQCVMVVPSAVAPRESNWLINPAHPDFARIELLEVEALDYDARLVKPDR